MPKLSESFTTERVLSAKSIVTQTPAGRGLSNAIIVSFGDPATSSDGAISVDANGVFTILDNTYEHQVDFTLVVNRQNSSGVAELYTWLEVAFDGVNFSQPPDSSTAYIEIDDSITTTRERADVVIPKSFPIGTKFRIKFCRHEDGRNDGRLLAKVPTGSLAGLNAEPSAQAYFSRIVGE